MAQRILITRTCDKCGSDDPDVTPMLVGLDGKPAREVDLCPADRQGLDWLVRAYTDAPEQVAHTCTICDRGFVSSRGLTRHRKVVHGG